MRAIKWIR